ncbi:unnamed protein product [Musa acuminata var. zebrina]
MTGRNQTSNPEPNGVRDCNLCSLREVLLAVARKNGLRDYKFQVEFLNPLNGEALDITKIDQFRSLDSSLQDDHILVAISNCMHIYIYSILYIFQVGCITCLEKGNACLRSISFGDAAQNLSMFSHTTWNMCSAGKILCTSVDRRKNYALFGGKGVELNLWDLENCSKIWTAKPPPSNSLGIFYPTWFTTATFLSEDIEKLWLGLTIIRIVFMILQHKGDL